MIDDLEPYPAYRDSGVPWLGEDAGTLGGATNQDAVP
jgi:hypothetical protein